MRILITGAAGLFGQTIVPLFSREIHLTLTDLVSNSSNLCLGYNKEYYPLNILDYDAICRLLEKTSPDIVFHLAAYTDVQNAEVEKATCYGINYQGTLNVARAIRYCEDCCDSPISLVYMSTDYVFDGIQGNYLETDIPDPLNYYALTKLFGEIAVLSATDHHLIIRTSFKPRPWKHRAAPIDMWTSADYVDVIAAEIVQVVENLNDIHGCLPELRDNPILHIGTGRKSVYDLAKQTLPDVNKTTRDEILRNTGLVLPEDVSLDSKLWECIRDNRI